MQKVTATGDPAGLPEVENEGRPDLAYFPAGQIEGDGWVLGVLRDLIDYSAFREMDEMTEALREAHRVAERLILH
jgi:hypothetical protein